jgi:hypothetical protein
MLLPKELVAAPCCALVDTLPHRWRRRRYKQAELKFREALEEAKLGFEPTDPHIASAKNNLAEFLRNTGRFEEAEKLYSEVG